MQTHSTELDGVLLIEPDVYSDARGSFQELWHQERYAQAGLPERFVQDNFSRSRRGVLRGLHFQSPRAQGKLVFVLEGEIFDVAVDIRRGLETFGRWLGMTLSAENRRQLYIPPGFAHGFCVTSNEALVMYKCTEIYHASDDRSIRWDDPAISIQWPLAKPILSPKDESAPRLADIPSQFLPE